MITPIAYPGGKSKVLPHILPHIKRMCGDNKTIVSPFLGGASVELALAADGYNVMASDISEPLINFWEVAADNRAGLLDAVMKYHPFKREDFKSLKAACVFDGDFVDYAAKYWVINRTSFGHLGLRARGASDECTRRFNANPVRKLEDFSMPDKLSVERRDWREALDEYSTFNAYLDPPYIFEGGKNDLYGRDGDDDFDHVALRDCLLAREGKWVMSYGDCIEVRDLYDGFYMVELSWEYTNSKKFGYELLIFSDNSQETMS